MALKKSFSLVGPDGSGKATLLGSLVYKCGMSLSMLERLEENHVTGYSSMIGYFRSHDIPPSFTTRSAIWEPTTIDECDTVLSVFDVNSAVSESAKFARSQRFGTLAQSAQKIIIVINKMDLADWSEQSFQEHAQVISEAIQAHNSNTRTVLVPVSARDGGNILEVSSKAAWHCAERQVEAEDQMTLVGALDA